VQTDDRRFRFDAHVPPTPTNTCTIGLDAVFAISGDPSAVMQAYNVRFGFNPQTKPTEMSSPYGRALVLTSEAPDQIGNLLYLIGATRDGHNYLSVRTCPDS
jgi:hypothetical protein